MRLIDADALKREWKMGDVCETCDQDTRECANSYCFSRMDVCGMIDDAPTVNGWISVKDDLPKEHDSIFANYPHLSKHMWVKESDNVIVYVRFPDGTGRSTEGRLQDGKWWTRVSPMLEPVVTHWMPLPEPPEVKK